MARVTTISGSESLVMTDTNRFSNVHNETLKKNSPTERRSFGAPFKGSIF